MVKLNPNEEVVESIKFRLRLMDGFCPCVPSEMGNPDYLCPCKKFQEEQVCCCELYVED